MPKLGPNGELLDDNGNPITGPIGGVPPQRVAAAMAGARPPTAVPSPTPAPPPPQGLATPYGQPFAPYEKDIGSTTNSSRATKISPEHQKTIDEMKGRTAAEVEQVKVKLERDKEVAELERSAAVDTLANEVDRTAKYDEAITRGEEAAAAARAKYQAESDKLAKMEPADYWGSRTPGQKFGAYFAIAMSGIAGTLSSKGKDPFGGMRAYQEILADQDRFNTKEKEKILRQEKLVERAEKGEEKARATLVQSLNAIDMRSAADARVTAAKLISAKKARGATDAEIAADDAINLLLRRDAEYMEKVFSRTDREVAHSTTKTIQQVTGAPPGSAAGKDERLKASSEDLNNIAGLSSTIKGLENVVGTIDAKPEAWKEFQGNSMAWQQQQARDKAPGVGTVQRVGQGLGLVDTSQDQGLKTPEAKGIYRQISQLTDSIAKMSGGVITEGDREGARQKLALAATLKPSEAKKLLGEVAGDMRQRLNLLTANRQVVLPEGVLPGAPPAAPAPKPAAAPSATPPAPVQGAVRKQHKVHGPGWFANGTFYPDAEAR